MDVRNPGGKSRVPQGTRLVGISREVNLEYEISRRELELTKTLNQQAKWTPRSDARRFLFRAYPGYLTDPGTPSFLPGTSGSLTCQSTRLDSVNASNEKYDDIFENKFSENPRKL